MHQERTEINHEVDDWADHLYCLPAALWFNRLNRHDETWLQTLRFVICAVQELSLYNNSLRTILNKDTRTVCVLVIKPYTTICFETLREQDKTGCRSCLCTKFTTSKSGVQRKTDRAPNTFSYERRPFIDKLRYILLKQPYTSKPGGY